MKHNAFTYRELFSFGWEKTKQHWWFLFCFGIAYAVISGAASFVPLLDLVVSMFLSIAIIVTTVDIADGHTPTWKGILKPFETYKTTWHAFLACLLFVPILLVALILFILPGIYLFVRLQFTLYAIVEDENLSAINALKKSMDLTRSMFWKLFGFTVLLTLFNFAGLLALGVGLLFTIPITCIAYARLYRKLSLHNAPHNHPPHEGAHIA